MKDWPGGSHLVLESCIEEQGLLAIGYKYNRKKVLFFIATKGSGNFEDGIPYQQRYPDKYGNLRTRAVPRPKIISDYFQESNNIDSHNQLRQAELKLEKRVLTNDCWLRIWTTLVGMTITDALRSLKFIGKKTRSNNAYMSINKFANRLAYECLHNNYDEEGSYNLPSIIKAAKLPVNAVTMDGITHMSSVSGNSHTPACYIDKHGVEHFMGILDTAKRRCCRVCYRDHK